MKMNNLGQIDNAWLVFADLSSEGAKSAECLELAELHSLAVDFPKKGVPAFMTADLKPKKYPDFMEKEPQRSYKSQKTIGWIYRSVSINNINGLQPIGNEPLSVLVIPGHESFMDESKKIYLSYQKEICSLMAQ
jgi:hypothetical protein